MRKSRDRFARQNPFCPPPQFPTASACSRKVHHLSGRTHYALAQILQVNDPDWPAVRRAPAGARLLPSSLSLRIGVCHPNTRTVCTLLGPCFKTGWTESFTWSASLATNSWRAAHCRVGARAHYQIVRARPPRHARRLPGGPRATGRFVPQSHARHAPAAYKFTRTARGRPRATLRRAFSRARN